MPRVGIPTINPRIVGPPPERHAARVVAEMCRWLISERDRLHNAQLAAMDASNSRFGNPKAQERLVNRMRKAGGNAILHMKLYPGKRARFSIREDNWQVFDPSKNIVISSGDQVPERPWLACMTTLFRLAPKHSGGSDARTGMQFLITHHAMQRLAERCGARTPDDLIRALTEIWSILKKRIDDANAAADGDIEVARKNMDWDSIPVAGGTAALEWDEKYNSLVVTTVLEVGMAVKKRRCAGE